MVGRSLECRIVTGEWPVPVRIGVKGGPSLLAMDGLN